MSDKKGLKQSRLPFQILTSPKVAGSEQKVQPAENASPKTPVVSRKRKQSSDGENMRLPKIGRTNSKENIVAEPDTIEIIDSDTDNPIPDKIDTSKNPVETTPTTSTAENKSSEIVRKIKIGKSTSKRKQVVKPIDDDSVVYLSEEELQSIQKSKKSTKKSEKKKTKAHNVSKDKHEAVRKSLNMNEKPAENDKSNVLPMEVDEIVLDDDDEDKKPEEPSTNDDKVEETQAKEDENNLKEFDIVLKRKEVPEKFDETFESKTLTETPQKSEEKSTEKSTAATENNYSLSEEISKLVDKSIDGDSSPDKELNDDIVEVLTDDEKNTSNNTTPTVAKKTAALTPKAIAWRQELEKRRVEKELQKQKEREEKEKQRLKEKEMREEAKRKEREEKEEMRKREKEEKEKKRLAELEKKEEEKRQKEEERKRLAEQKEEEKRAKEEERRQKEEERKRQKESLEEERKKKESEKMKEEERKKKAAEAFSKFFVPSKKKIEPQIIDDEASKESAESSETTKGNFMPFQIHGKMRLAPRVRTEFSALQKDFLDGCLKSSEKAVDELYLKQLKRDGYVPKGSTKTWPAEEEKEEDDVVVIDELEGVGEDIKEDEAHSKFKYRAKLLLFKENRRPAYYGTWRKKSKTISARRPFAQDAKFFDYEVDSDDEWEEEEPGESLHGSDSEKEKEKEDEDYELDDDFFVPHGHLSEDEMQHDDEIMEDNSPETQKAKLKVLQQEFAAEMKKKTEKIKPRLIGCIWMNGDEDEDGGSMIGNIEKKYHCSDIIWRILKAREMMSSGEPIKMEDFEPEIVESEEDNNHDEKSTKQQKTPAAVKVRPKIEGESVKELIKLLHGNINSKKFLIKEFQAYRLKNYHKLPDYQEFITKSVDEKIMEISVYKTCPDEGPMFGKKCWYVKEEFIKEYFGDEKLPMPNQWTYILEKEKKVKPSNNNESKKGSREVSPNTDQSKVNDNRVTEPAKAVISESPKPSTSFKITNFVKSSPKTPSNQSSVPANKKQVTPVQNKPATPIQVRHSPSVQSKVTTNGSPSTAPSIAMRNGSDGKKRVSLLMSCKLNQSIDVEKKNLLVNNFIKTNPSKEVVKVSNVDDIIEIID